MQDADGIPVAGYGTLIVCCGMPEMSSGIVAALWHGVAYLRPLKQRAAK